MQMNNLMIAGFLGKDAQEVQTRAGSKMVTFNICHTLKGKNGHPDVSTWIRVKSFGAWSESAATLKKGDNVFLTGPISFNEYEKDGKKFASIEMIANSIGLLQKMEARKDAAVESIDNWADVPF